MLGLFRLITDFLITAFGVDADALRVEMQDCYNGIRNAVAAMVICLPICYGLAVAGYHYDIANAEWCHALYALIAIGCLAKIYRHIMVAYGLIEANKAFIVYTLDKAAAISAAGGDGAEALAKAIVDAQAKFKAIIDEKEGEWGDMALQAITEALTPLRLSEDGAKTLLRHFADDIRKFSQSLKDIRKILKDTLRKEALPTSQFFVRLAVVVILFSLINTVWPWWANPPAYLLAVVAGILSLAASFNSMKVEILPEEAAKPKFPALPTWLRRSLYLGALCAIVLAFKVSGFDSLGGIENHLALAYVTAAPFLVVILFYAFHLGWQKSTAYGLAAIAISAMVWANWHETVPRYVRTMRVGGIAICDRHRASRDTYGVSNSFWSRRGEYIFTPRPGAELLDNGVNLICLDSQAEKDIAGEPWVRVIRVDSEGHPIQEEPGWVPFRKNYVESMPGPGLPQAAVDDPTYDQAMGRQKLEAGNTIEFMRAMVQKFGQDFQHITWSGFKPLPDTLASPLAVPYEIGNGFSSAVNVYTEYSGVDLYCDASQDEVPVLAAADGVVEFIVVNARRAIAIRHKNGLYTYYGNLRKLPATVGAGPLVHGTKVKKGEIIGYVSRGEKFEPYGGCTYLYFACVRRQTNGFLNPVDPMPILGKAPYPPIPWEIQKQQEEASFAHQDGDEEASN